MMSKVKLEATIETNEDEGLSGMHFVAETLEFEPPEGEAPVGLVDRTLKAFDKSLDQIRRALSQKLSEVADKAKTTENVG